MTTNLSGGCGCGALRYLLWSGPMIVHCCHCKDCQRQTGSAFVVNAVIEVFYSSVEDFWPAEAQARRRALGF